MMRWCCHVLHGATAPPDRGHGSRDAVSARGCRRSGTSKDANGRSAAGSQLTPVGGDLQAQQEHDDGQHAPRRPARSPTPRDSGSDHPVERAAHPAAAGAPPQRAGEHDAADEQGHRERRRRRRSRAARRPTARPALHSSSSRVPGSDCTRCHGVRRASWTPSYHLRPRQPAPVADRAGGQRAAAQQPDGDHHQARGDPGGGRDAAPTTAAATETSSSRRARSAHGTGGAGSLDRRAGRAARPTRARADPGDRARGAGRGPARAGATGGAATGSTAVGITSVCGAGCEASASGGRRQRRRERRRPWAAAAAPVGGRGGWSAAAARPGARRASGRLARLGVERGGEHVAQRRRARR